MTDISAIKARYSDNGLTPAEYSKLSSVDIARMRSDIKHLLKEVERLENINRWIPAVENPPICGDGELIAFLTPSAFNQKILHAGVARYFYPDNWSNKEIKRAIYWMPLPEPPK